MEFNRVGYKSDLKIMSFLTQSHTSKVNWPDDHVLSRESSYENSVSFLLAEIKDMDVGVDLIALENLANLKSLREILTRIVKRHHEAPFVYMARHYSVKRIPRDGNDGKNVNPGQVLRFLSACVLHVMPLEFFGSMKNRKIFMYRWLSVLVGVPGRKSVGLGRLMEGVKIKQVLWTEKLLGSGGRGPRACVIAKAWLWVLLKYVNIILSCHFVCVKNSGDGYGGRPFVFFQKRTWQSIKDTTIRLHTACERAVTADERVNYKGWTIIPITSDEKVKFMKPIGYPLVSGLQLRLKKNGVRPVIRVRFYERDDLKVKACVALLNYLNGNVRKRCPSKNTLKDITQAWDIMYEIKNKEHLMDTSNGGKDEPVFQAVTVDVEDAFGCVIHDKLCEIIEKKIEAAGLTNDSCVALRTLLKNVKTRGGKSFYKYSYVLLGLPQLNYDVDRCEKKVKFNKIHTEPFMIGELHEFILRCIKCQIIKIGKKHYRLLQGLAQGSVLSPALWDMYCQALEEEHLIPHLSIGEEANDFSYLIRGMDDYLFLTIKASEAEWFLAKMIDGFPDYNVHIKKSKLCTTLSSIKAVNVKKENQGVFGAAGVKFWGLMLNLKEYTIMIDYGGHPGRDMIHSMSLCIEKKPKKVLEEVCFIGHIKLPPMLLNSKYNGYKGVLCNIYRAALMQVARFHAVVRVALQPVGEKPSDDIVRQEVESVDSDITIYISSEEEQNASHKADDFNCPIKEKSFLLKKKRPKRSVPNQTLLSTFLYDQARNLATVIHSIGKKHDLQVLPSFPEIISLAYKAYKVVLAKQGSRYPDLLKKIKYLDKCISTKISDEKTILLQEVLEYCKKIDS